MKRSKKKKPTLRLSVRTGRDNPASDLVVMGEAMLQIGRALEQFPPAKQAEIFKRALELLPARTRRRLAR